MKTCPVFRSAGSFLLCTTAVLAGDPQSKAPVLPPPALGTASQSPHFRVSAGWMHRSLGGVHFQSVSRSQSVRVPRFFGQDTRRDAPVGSADKVGDRFYEDGFVKVDQGTFYDGTTAHWGYDDNAQVQGDGLEFHASGSRHETTPATTAYEPAGEWNFDSEGSAPVIQLDWAYEINPVWSLGLQAQWSLLGIDGSHRGSNVSATRTARDYRVNFTDRYALQGIIPPTAPYQGSGSGNGPLLDNLPGSRSLTEKLIGEDRVDLFNDVRESLEVDLNTVSLGPSVSARLGPVSLQAAAGLALNIASWDASYQESLLVARNGGKASTLAKWSEKAGGTDVLPGFFLQGALILPVTTRITLTGFGRYDWSKTLHGDIGPSTFSVDPGGWSAGAIIGVAF